jgi:RepB DNA-primase N-terminal domain/RepB DNA-primase C-terminal helical domain
MKPAMEAQRDSRVIAARVAMDQLEAMGAAAFDIGVKRTDGTMLLREGWGAKQVLKSLLWLRRENLNRGHIYVRPAGIHGLSLVDDLKADALARMKAEGFKPAALVETSPGNLQAWLKHGVTLDEVTATRTAKLLAQRYGGDLGSADWRHFGRLAGFTNPKPNRRLASGLQPFARLLGASGQIYQQAPLFIAEVRAAMAGEPVSKTGGSDTQGIGQGAPELPPLRSLAEFQNDSRYGGDLHRADLAWARHAAAMGLSASEIRAAIMEARDLAKKGSARRQREYAERTAEKAVGQTE